MSHDPQQLSGTQPPLLYPPYNSTIRRAPREALIRLPESLSDLNVPVYGSFPIAETDNDLTRQYPGEPQGQRIAVAGRVLDEDGRPLRDTLVEIWQTNAGGRYRHAKDEHPAPLDPNFAGAGRTITDAEGRYHFTTIRPGAYPWRNHDNAWRPAHIHFSIFGWCFRTRLVTQMYFPDDPLFAYDPVLQAIRDERARQRLVSHFDLALTTPEWALGYRFDIVARGSAATPFEGAYVSEHEQDLVATASETVGPFFHFGLATDPALGCVADPSVPGDHITLAFRVTDGEGAAVPDALIEIWQVDAQGAPAPLPASVGRPAAFRGFGRLATGEDGQCEFQTVRPGRAGRTGADPQAPHINICLFARGLLRQVHTRVYFPDDPALADDAVLGLVPAARRTTLLATRDGANPARWKFDLRLQGERETVFFDV